MDTETASKFNVAEDDHDFSDEIPNTKCLR